MGTFCTFIHWAVQISDKIRIFKINILVTTAGCSLTFQFASAPPALNPNAFPDSNSVLLFLNAKILPLLGPSLLRLVVWGQFQHEDAGTDFFVRLLSLPAVLETNSIKLNLLSVEGTSATFSLAATPSSTGSTTKTLWLYTIRN